MSVAIVYCSRHHGNTRKLVDAISRRHPVTLIDASAQPEADLTGFDLIGFASGIYAFSFDPSVIALAGRVQADQSVFLLYTSAMNRDAHAKSIRQTLEARGAHVLGIYGCPGYNTFGPFRLIGGTSKGRPDEKDVAGAVSFFEKMAGQDAGA